MPCCVSGFQFAFCVSRFLREGCERHPPAPPMSRASRAARSIVSHRRVHVAPAASIVPSCSMLCVPFLHRQPLPRVLCTVLVRRTPPRAPRRTRSPRASSASSRWGRSRLSARRLLSTREDAVGHCRRQLRQASSHAACATYVVSLATLTAADSSCKNDDDDKSGVLVEASMTALQRD